MSRRGTRTGTPWTTRSETRSPRSGPRDGRPPDGAGGHLRLDRPTLGRVRRVWRKVATSIVTVAEPQYGLHTARTPIEQVRRRRRLQLLLDSCEVLPIDLAVTEIYGAVAQMGRSVGRKPGPRALDLLIAATAARHKLPVLTRNHADLKGLGEAVVVIPVR